MKKTLKTNILKQIESGEVKMRSRFEVWGEKFGIGGTVISLILGLVLISGFISYWLNLNSDLLFGGYGKFGLNVFTQTFPYILVIIFVALFFALSHILKRFDFSYKKPFIATLSVLVALVLVLGCFSLATPIGRGFYQRQGRYLGMGRLSNSANSVYGTVSQISGNTIFISTEDGKSVSIKTSENTHYPFGTPQVGNTIRSIGSWNGNIFEAIGIRVFGENDMNELQGGYGKDLKMKGQGKNRWSN